MTLSEELRAWDESVVLGEGAGAIEIVPERIREVCLRLRDQMQYVRLSAVTAVDRYPTEPRFEVVYLLHSIERNERARLKCRLPGDAAEIDSVCAVWPSANWYEREVFDLFGVRFVGHPDLRRIMLPDDWEGHPLRRDVPLGSEPVDFTVTRQVYGAD